MLYAHQSTNKTELEASFPNTPRLMRKCLEAFAWTDRRGWLEFLKTPLLYVSLFPRTLLSTMPPAVLNAQATLP